MLNVSPSELVPLVGPTTDFVRTEILRVGAPLAELEMAIAFVGGEAALHPRAYQSLPPRLRRLVDLVAVAGADLAKSICATAKGETVGAGGRLGA